MSYAVKCLCGHPSCKHWHVEPEAAVQGVSFTEEQAHLVASVLNKSDQSKNLGIVKLNGFAGKTLLEFEYGALVKIDGMRPEYIDGIKMIALIKLLAKELLNERQMNGAAK